MEQFRSQNLKNFYRDKLTEIKDLTSSTFNAATFSGWAQQAKKMQFNTLFSEVVDVLSAVVEVALDVKDLLDFVQQREQELIDKMLQQSNPERVSNQKHRTRR
jgi:hypothetical protein